MNTAKIIGRRLSALREENGFTQEDVQKLTGINRTTYSKNESGKATPSLSNLHILAKLYGVSLDYLCEIENRALYTLYDSGKNTTKDEKMLVSYYRLLSDADKESIIELIRKKADENINVIQNQN